MAKERTGGVVIVRLDDNSDDLRTVWYVEDAEEARRLAADEVEKDGIRAVYVLPVVSKSTKSWEVVSPLGRATVVAVVGWYHAQRFTGFNMVLPAEANAFTQLDTAIITAVGGIVARAVTAGLPIWLTWRNKYKKEKGKYQEERVKHRTDLEEAKKRERELGEALASLGRRLEQIEQFEVQQGEGMSSDQVQSILTALRGLMDRVEKLTTTVNSLQQRGTALEQRLQQPEPEEPEEDFTEQIGDGDLPPPWSAPPPGERKPVWFRGRVYRFVRFRGSNSRIETFDARPDALGELREQGGTTGTIQNFRLFNDREERRPITRSSLASSSR